MSRRARQIRRRRSQGGPARIVAVLFGLMASVVVIAIVAGLGWVVSVAASGPDISELAPIPQDSTSIVYASDGTTRLGYIQGDTLRTPVAASAMPQVIRDATVAIEDKRFYKHGGVDFEGVVRAAIKNASKGGTVEGGSTLTMQLVRNLYTEDTVRSGVAGYKRKIREAKLASELEDKHPGLAGKRWLLTQYLNNVPYGTVGGQTAVGIQAAARVFFGKSAAGLTLPEAALLAGLPQAPSLYNPLLDPQRATQRRAEVLDAMAAEGYITPAQAQEAKQAPLSVRRNTYYAKKRESYFFDFVKQQLIEEYGLARVQRGGMRVFTTLDLKLQRRATQAIAERLPNPGDPAAAVVTMDPKTGHILAMTSSGDYRSSVFNLAAQGRRQPGSTFKVMVMMAAIRQGVDIRNTTYESQPLDFFDQKTGTQIKVVTDDHAYVGAATIFNSLVRSDNTVFQQLDLDVTPEAVRQTAYDMGITSKLDAYPAEGLGGLTNGVSPLEMARAYATISNGGWRVKPIVIDHVVFPGGRTDTAIGKPERVKIFTDGETHQATLAMEANVQGGTGTRAQIGCPAAGKTGTTSSFTDAWFDGFTSSLGTVVWVGYPNATTSMTSVPGWGTMFGGMAPAAIWHDVMAYAMESRPCDPFPEPSEPFVSRPVDLFYSSNPPTPAEDPLDLEAKKKAEEEKKKKEAAKKKKEAEKNKYPDNQYESPPQDGPGTTDPGTTDPGTTPGGDPGTGGTTPG
ncbi:unannotated protein [freshwater metagenome]|uniref:peptidoglycan glycosyltransferase n=1 Tax=freshwater metagenome TaxID=449393 RepID=A0A6J7CJP2_9ZZZZ|nr:glycosyl transferase [Actinomycetota bacterium]